MMNALSQIWMTAAGIGMSVDRSVPLSERLRIGLETAVIGLMMVFAILMILWGVLVLFRIFFYELPKKRREADKPVSAPEPEPKPAPAVREAPAEAGTPDDAELVAAITAAVSAYLEAESAETDIPATGFRVVSFRRAGRR